MTAPHSSSRRLLLGLLLLVCAGLIGAGIWWSLRPRPEPIDAAVLSLNNRGVGAMEKFEYAPAIPPNGSSAVEIFEDVTRKAPHWTPGWVNLGIALLNCAQEEQLDRAVGIFQDVLKKEPDNLHAHYCLGIIATHRGNADEALPHFEAVTRGDPQDSSAWYYLGNALSNASTPQPQRTRDCYRKALERNPNLIAALYGLSMALRRDDPKESKELLERFQARKRAGEPTVPDIKYTRMGHYAEAIGRTEHPPIQVGPLPVFQRADELKGQLAEGTRWAADADLGQGPEADLRRAVRQHLGGALVLLDYDDDGKPDVLLAGAVIRRGKVGNLLLHNEGPGGFRDVTAEAGLADAPAALAASAADFDNDGHGDLLLAGPGGVRLYRNDPKGKTRFTDVTKEAGLADLTDVCLGATFVDLDQDGDLDLVLARLGADTAAALANLRGGGGKGPGLACLLNVGEALPNATSDLAPLTPRFKRERPAGFPDDALPFVGVAISDVDSDRDVDLIALPLGAAPFLVLNDRLLRFHKRALPDKLLETGRWNGALILDARHTERSDLLFVGPGQKPAFLIHERTGSDTEAGLKLGPIDAPPLLQAQAVDLDLDGWTDVLGLSDERKPVLLHNEAGRLAHARAALGADTDWPDDLLAVAAAPLGTAGPADLLLWSAAGGLQVRRTQGNANRALLLDVSGRVDTKREVRCNPDAIGTRVVAQAGPLYTGLEKGTLHTGPGQSRLPVLLGLGPHAEADVTRLRWPDGVWQAELALTAGAHQIAQRNRMPVSCPLLFAWDGTRYQFIGDVLGAGSLGEPLPGGGHRLPRPEEALLLRPGQLAPRDGRYLFRVAEPMDEATYLDRLQLVAIDHPARLRVVPDERFDTAGKPPTQDLYLFEAAQRVFARQATDHRGRDVTATLRAWDRRTLDFARRSWLGFAEDHHVVLDFGTQLARLSPQQPAVLCLAGWTDYPYPESIWAAAQAGVSMKPPRLERRGADGTWRTLGGEAGFPAGLPRLMTLDVTGQLSGPECVLRLGTNLHVYWDQIYVAPVRARIAASRLTPGARITTDACTVHCLEVARARLVPAGCPQEFSPDGRPPVMYDHGRRAAVPVTRLQGKLTRYGDVSELLTGRDDRFVVFGPGDEAAVEFDATALPTLPPGWERTFVMRSWGYCKDAAPFTATGGTVEPLPFAAMTRFPYGPTERYPTTPAHADYLRRYQTRAVGSQQRAGRVSDGS